MGAGLSLALLLGGAVALADVPNTFVAGETLKAAELNANFDDLDGKVAGLDADLVVLSQDLDSASQSIAETNLDLSGLDTALNQELTGRLEAGTTGPSTGTIVGGVVAPASTQMLWQSATTVQVTNGSGETTIAFPTAFPNGVASVLVSNGEDFAALGSVGFAVVNSQVTTSGFVVRARVGGGGLVPNQVLRFNWIAIGW